MMSTSSTFKELLDMRLVSMRLVLCILLFFSVELTQIPKGNAELPADEISALEDFRDTFNLANWTGDPCDTVSWITCVPNKLNVNGMNLTARNLSGNIPDSLSDMKNIKNLYLAKNPNLTGVLPDLTALIILNFDASFCSLSGPVPDLRTSGGLEILNLQNNQFSGALPTALFQHGFLNTVPFMNRRLYERTGTHMFLNNNPFITGAIPPTNLATAIITFHLNDCNLNGAVPDLSLNVAVQEIALQNNQLTKFTSNDLKVLTKLTSINVDNNKLAGQLPDLPPSSSQAQDQPHLEQIIFSNNQFFGEIPSSWYQLGWAKQMNLKNNSLSGPIGDAIINLNRLEILDLRNNQFNGTVPKALADIPTLKTLLLDNNRFTGIPQALANKIGLNITFTNNPNIMVLADASKSKGSPLGTIVGGVIGVLALLVVIAVVVIVRRRKKKNKNLEDQVNKEDMPKSAQSFSLKEIKAITQNYKTLIGKGGFGPVYWGKLPNGKEVAVKVRANDSKQGADEFLNEVRLLSRLHHRNLVSLVGYCLEAQQQILLYVYMPQGTLHDHLYRKGSHSNPSSSNSEHSLTQHEAMSWKKRLDIAMNAARGLEYLHKDCKPPVIHRDVKTANILLTEKLQAKVADLGISKQAPELDSEEQEVHTGVSTVIKGTFGYLDPEYYVRRRLTTKSDVYSFGMVLLEIITGKKPQTHRFPKSNATTLAEWVRNAVNTDQIESVVDPNLRGQYEKEGMLKVARIALQCQLPSGGQRPEMGDVVRTVTQALQLEGDYVDTSIRTNDDEEEPFSEDPVSGQVSVTLSSINELTATTPSSVSSDPVFHPSWNTMPR